MAELTDEQIEAANERGRMMRETLPHATAARYDRATGRIVIDLTNGATFAFPPHLAQHLAGASPEDLADIELSGDGFGLHWPRLDEDLTVPGLLSGLFGTRKWMATLAARRRPPPKPPPRNAMVQKAAAPAKPPPDPAVAHPSHGEAECHATGAAPSGLATICHGSQFRIGTSRSRAQA
jgi:hypothetical protein